jgi:choice-of-anchor B domain-containing protein
MAWARVPCVMALALTLAVRGAAGEVSATVAHELPGELECDGFCAEPVQRGPVMMRMMAARQKHSRGKMQRLAAHDAAEASGASSSSWLRGGGRFSTPGAPVPRGAASPCIGGLSGGVYPCRGVDMLSLVPRSELGVGAGFFMNDVWGWVDPASGREYALSGAMDGVTVVDVTDPVRPAAIMRIPSGAKATSGSYWRDIKVFNNTAYIVADVIRNQVQVVDLRRVRAFAPGGASFPPPAKVQDFKPDFAYSGLKLAHNIFVNERSGFAYAVGGDTCGGGVHLLDLRANSLRPKFAGCWGEAWTHDIQCVQYAGPDTRFTGREICFAFQAEVGHVAVVDFTDKTVDPVTKKLSKLKVLARVKYPQASYTHQGWLTEDQSKLLFNDETFNLGVAKPTKTFVLDLAKLDKAVFQFSYAFPEISLAHNLYILGNSAFCSNYGSGLRVLDLSGLKAAQPKLTELAFFDAFPTPRKKASWDGVWSAYIYLPSGNILLNSIEYGLFTLRLSR